VPLGVRGPHAQPLQPRGHLGDLAAPAQQPVAPELARVDDRDVLAQRRIQERGVGVPLGRHERDPGREGPVRAVRHDVVAADGDGSGARDAPEQRGRELLAARPGDARDADDLPGAHVEVHAREHAGAHAPHLQHRRSRRPGDVGGHGELLQRPADHETDQAVLVQTRDRPGDDVAPVAQHRHRVAQAEHLVEVVGDEQDRDALVAHRPDDAEQPLDLRRRQVGGRLVEHQHPRRRRARRQCPGERDGRALADDEVARGLPDVEVVTQPQERLAREALLLPPGDQPQPVALVAVAHREVVAGVERRDQPEVLVHEPQPGVVARAGRPEGQGHAVDEHLRARVRLVVTGENLDQRGLAAAVLAHQRAHLAGLEIDVDIDQRTLAGEGLRESADLESGRRRHPAPRDSGRGGTFVTPTQ
jgi:hypothetical protein